MKVYRISSHKVKQSGADRKSKQVEGKFMNI